MKEFDIRPKKIFDEYLRLSQEDAKTFFKGRREAQVCPACLEENCPEAFEKLGFHYSECSECETLFLSPRPHKEEFNHFYENSPSSNYWSNVFFPSVAEPRREKIFKPRVELLAKLMDEKKINIKKVVDIGAGYGVFLEEWKKKFPESKVVAVEPGSESAKVCRSKGIEVLEVMAEDLKGKNVNATLMTSFEVIEHVHSPFDFISAIYDALAPGGYCLVSGLCVDGFDIQTLWEKSKSISPPHHINFMSVEGFEKLFKRVGFSEVTVLTPGVLDVDIVKNTLSEHHDEIDISRFEKKILKKRVQFHEDFQLFLKKALLSSHGWILARK